MLTTPTDWNKYMNRSGVEPVILVDWVYGSPLTVGLSSVTTHRFSTGFVSITDGGTPSTYIANIEGISSLSKEVNIETREASIGAMDIQFIDDGVVRDIVKGSQFAGSRINMYLGSSDMSTKSQFLQVGSFIAKEVLPDEGSITLTCYDLGYFLEGRKIGPRFWSNAHPAEVIHDALLSAGVGGVGGTWLSQVVDTSTLGFTDQTLRFATSSGWDGTSGTTFVITVQSGHGIRKGNLITFDTATAAADFSVDAPVVAVTDTTITINNPIYTITGQVTLPTSSATEVGQVTYTGGRFVPSTSTQIEKYRQWVVSKFDLVEDTIEINVGVNSGGQNVRDLINDLSSLLWATFSPDEDGKFRWKIYDPDASVVRHFDDDTISSFSQTATADQLYNTVQVDIGNAKRAAYAVQKSIFVKESESSADMVIGFSQTDSASKGRTNFGGFDTGEYTLTFKTNWLCGVSKFLYPFRNLKDSRFDISSDRQNWENGYTSSKHNILMDHNSIQVTGAYLNGFCGARADVFVRTASNAGRPSSTFPVQSVPLEYTIRASTACDATHPAYLMIEGPCRGPRAAQYDSTLSRFVEGYNGSVQNGAGFMTRSAGNPEDVAFNQAPTTYHKEIVKVTEWKIDASKYATQFSGIGPNSRDPNNSVEVITSGDNKPSSGFSHVYKSIAITQKDSLGPFQKFPNDPNRGDGRYVSRDIGVLGSGPLPTGDEGTWANPIALPSPTFPLTTEENPSTGTHTDVYHLYENKGLRAVIDGTSDDTPFSGGTGNTALKDRWDKLGLVNRHGGPALFRISNPVKDFGGIPSGRGQFGTTVPFEWMTRASNVLGSADTEDNGESIFEAKVWDVTLLVHAVTQRLDRFANGVMRADIKVPIHNADLQVGDFITLDNATAIKYGKNGVDSNTVFEVTKKELDIFSDEPGILLGLAWVRDNTTFATAVVSEPLTATPGTGSTASSSVGTINATMTIGSSNVLVPVYTRAGEEIRTSVTRPVGS